MSQLLTVTDSMREEIPLLPKLPSPIPFPAPLPRVSTRSRTRSTAGFDQVALMRSIRRGSMDWRALMRPFVSSLAFRCIWKRRLESEISFSPWSGHAAVLFVDLSGYSKITAALAKKAGAHLVSMVVNAYMERLLNIVHAYSGDVVKFAGDAILIVWESNDVNNMAECVICAASCAMKMQEQAGNHPVEGTDLCFRVHIGLACGQLDTEVFEAPTTQSMQRLYHAVSGAPLRDIGDLAELAAPGEVAISHRCMTLLGCRGKYRHAGEDLYTDARILEALTLSPEDEDKMDELMDKLMDDREDVRCVDMEEDFVHPEVLNLLVHSGHSPTQIAQMRNLCVLFIAMTSSISPVNWLKEVQGILDKHRCPIVQIIDDDKGVHLVAAINLYESTPEATTLALDTCRELIDRQVGCAIGLAMGSTFCGCHGSAKVAVRWDITGPPAVRAARLMQWAIQEDHEVVIDESVYENTRASTRMEPLAKINVKGTVDPISVFRLSDSTNFVASMIVEHLALAPVHEEVCQEVYEILSGPKPRGVVVLTGPPLSGKKSVFQRAAGLASLVPVLHLCDSGGEHLQLARTIATWYEHCNHKQVQKLALVVLDHLDNQRWTRAHEDCVHLFNIAMIAGFYGCFIVDRCQFLDDFSLSLIRECVGGSIRTKRWALRNSSMHSTSSVGDSLTSSISEISVEGKVFFLCTHRPLYDWTTDESFVYDLCRTRDIEVPVFKVEEVSIDELRKALHMVTDLDCEDDWLHLYAQQCGYSAGYFFNLGRTIRLISSKMMKEGVAGLSMINQELKMFVRPDMKRHFRAVNVTHVSAEVQMRFVQAYDELPPRHQMLMKVVAFGNCGCFYKCPYSVAGMVLDDLFDDGVDQEYFKIIIDELEELYMIKVENDGNERTIIARSPAITDVVMDVCTPSQIQSISNALMGRLECRLNDSYKVSVVCSELCGHTKQRRRRRRYWKRAYTKLLAESEEWPLCRQGRHRDFLVDCILNAGEDPVAVLGLLEIPPSFPTCTTVPVSRSLLVMKNYSAPIGYGPMGHTLTIITRNAFREYRVFCDAPKEEIETLRRDSKSAFERIEDEIGRIENFLKQLGSGTPENDLKIELELLDQLVQPAMKTQDVLKKAKLLEDHLVPSHTRKRLERMYQACQRLREDKELADSIMTIAPHAIRCAWRTLRKYSDFGNDAVQHALVTLATENWEPRMIPEDLPISNYQTTCVVRDAVLRKLSDDEVDLFQHQQGLDDFEAFLVSTALVNPFICFRHNKKWC